MSNEKIFSITGKEVLKEQSCSKKDDRKDEGPEVSTISYRSGLHVFTILFGCGLTMSQPNAKALICSFKHGIML